MFKYWSYQSCLQIENLEAQQVNIYPKYKASKQKSQILGLVFFI